MTMQSRTTRFIYTLFIAFTTLFTINTAIISNAAAKPSEYEKLVKAGAKAYNNQDYDAALTSFKEAYALQPESALLYNIGRVCEDKADYNCAIEHYRKFLLAPGSDPDAREDAKDRIKSCTETLELAGGYVPTLTNTNAAAPAASGSAPLPASAGGKCVDLNTASAAQLETIKGLGPAKSKAILEYRKTHPFTSFDQLLEVNGIAEATKNKFIPYLCPLNATAKAAAPAKNDAVAAKPAAKAEPAKAAPKASTPKSKETKPTKAANSFDI